MLTSFALIFISGIFLGGVFQKIHLPGLIGMLIAGIMLGPQGFDVINDSVLSISAELRQVALIIILLRAGVSLDLAALKKVGRPAALMCFVPACFELAGTVVLAPRLLGITNLEAAIMGTVLAAVSPAVIVPRMLSLMEEQYGSDKSIPQLIMTGASVDDIFVIVLFSSFTAVATGQKFSWWMFGRIPVSIVLGVLVGILVGFLFAALFKRVHMRDSVKLVLLLSAAFLCVSAEKTIADIIPFAGLLAVMTMGIFLRRSYPVLAGRIAVKLNKAWVLAEILLFVLVGTTVDVSYAMAASVSYLSLIELAMVFRMAGVMICLMKTSLNRKERLFCLIAYAPKATVQAAIGGLPLAMGLACGRAVLTAAVIAILVTAPLGALGIDLTYKKLLYKSSFKSPG